MRGRVEAGHSGGGNAYGYQVVRRIDANGQPVTGEREIDPAQAAIVTRIFQAYADGQSPKRIALDLNAASIPGPRGGAWSSSTIKGNRGRGTGILNNTLYVGQLSWNRLAYAKDPETGRRRSRLRNAQEQVITEVPHLRIVDEALWAAARTRQAGLDQRNATPEAGDTVAASSAPETPRPFWSKQRPRYLFSGLMQCGVCGGGFSKISALHFGCSTARNKGETVCGNLRTIRRDVLEQRALQTLRTRLMDPELYQAFAAAFVVEWNSLQGNASADRAAQESELKQVCQQIERLVDALVNGTLAAAAVAQLRRFEIEVLGDVAAMIRLGRRWPGMGRSNARRRRDPVWIRRRI